MKRLEESGPNELIALHEPVNRFPDFVTQIVQKLKCLNPAMGRRRIADTLARAGLHLGSSTVRRMLRKPEQPVPESPAGEQTTPEDAPSSGRAQDDTTTSPRVVNARYPHHLWHVDLTVMPTSAGLCLPFLPPLLQRFPFAWWIGVVVDHFSRSAVGFEVFRSEPSERQVCAMLSQAARDAGCAPKHIVSDRGSQFGKRYLAWCARNAIKPRFGAVGQHGSIAIIERFIRSLKDEHLRRILIPYRFADMRLEVAKYIDWYGEHRPHRALGCATPHEVLHTEWPAILEPRIEPRARYPVDGDSTSPQVPVRGERGARLRLVMTPHDGAPHLPVVELREAA